MKSFDEIVETALNQRLADLSSEQAVSACQTFASDGRFEDMANFLNIWIKKYPNAKKYLVNKIPGIVLNRYIFTKPELSSSKTKIDAWIAANPVWAEQLTSVCQEPKKFPSVVSKLCELIEQYTKATP